MPHCMGRATKVISSSHQAGNYFLWCMNIVVPQSAYISTMQSCDPGRGRLDTRLFTSNICNGTSQVRGEQLPLGSVRLWVSMWCTMTPPPLSWWNTYCRPWLTDQVPQLRHNQSSKAEFALMVNSWNGCHMGRHWTGCKLQDAVVIIAPPSYRRQGLAPPT